MVYDMGYSQSTKQFVPNNAEAIEIPIAPYEEKREYIKSVTNIFSAISSVGGFLTPMLLFWRFSATMYQDLAYNLSVMSLMYVVREGAEKS